MNFDVPVTQNGDNWDRMWVRLQEMKESAKMVRQCMAELPDGITRTEADFFIRPPVGEVYSAIEATKGELGFYLVSDGTIAPLPLRHPRSLVHQPHRPARTLHRLETGRSHRELRHPGHQRRRG